MKTFNDNFSAQTNEQAESKITSLLANSRQDNVLVTSEVVPLEKLTGMPSRRGLENAIICENQIVNVVSNSYGHLPNEKFFLGVEEKLIDADIYYPCHLSPQFCIGHLLGYNPQRMNDYRG